MPSIDSPQNARSRRTRTALLDATRALIEEEGFDALTTTSAAERAGVSRRAVYLHFSSRNELLAALYRHLGETEDLGTSLQAVWNSPDAVTALDEWAHHMARSHPRILAVSRAIERARYTDDDAAGLWNLTMSNWLTGCTRLMEWLDADGALSPSWTVSSAADMLWALMSWDLLERLTADRGWAPEQFGEQYAAMLTATFVRPGAPERGGAV
ncbi:TetR family transcriptional regulator [Haloactinopolyspora alba]|uniref:TetR family transcriptional regulator n=1 Tax=Haloactinopolyspora alba TaxID=648780 RepID=A0A2P8E5N0_9ACTN|nr:TetR/AcrR family transcriptional regulator [Haloactinopolyspora alba]PSL04772.1 TetR family transcriptional regulator [Haloactinopolyspora alba]